MLRAMHLNDLGRTVSQLEPNVDAERTIPRKVGLRQASEKKARSFLPGWARMPMAALSRYSDFARFHWLMESGEEDLSSSSVVVCRFKRGGLIDG
jgi:hypothetical protein